MALRFKYVILSFLVSCGLVGCSTVELRVPASVDEVYKNSELQKGLVLAASNNILFSIPQSTLTDVEKTEIDPLCREFQQPFWSQKLSVYLTAMRRHPEWMNKFHVLELKKGDVPDVQIQTDMDGAKVLSIHYVLSEEIGKVTMKTQLPCQQNLIDYIGKPITKTVYEFPSMKKFEDLLAESDDKKDIPRFSFNNEFLVFLAERGAILKYTHELSFEKNSKGKFVMAEALNKLSKEVRLKNFGYVNLWLKKINENSSQAELIQLFGLVSEKDSRAGIRVDSNGEFARKSLGQPDVTYLFTTYNSDGEFVETFPLTDFDQCLMKMTKDMSFIQLRKPSSQDERESYMHPGFSCPVDSVVPNSDLNTSKR